MASYTASGGISPPFYFGDAGWVSDTIDDRFAEPDETESISTILLLHTVTNETCFYDILLV